MPFARGSGPGQHPTGLPPVAALAEEKTATARTAARRLMDNIGQVVLGRRDLIRFAVTAVFAQGHLLVEDVPGTGKTTLARALAASIDGVCRRIQFTPDLLPTDVTGVTVYHQSTDAFTFHPGPVFANVVIADEINRGSPRTQSALLEVMEEQQVTVDGERHPVPRPFLVVATQNPVEMAGTYPLPEAQLDRFLMRLRVGYPNPAEELEVLRAGVARRSPDELTPVLDVATVATLASQVPAVYVQELSYRYVVDLARASRTHRDVRVGLSPRGAVALVRAAQAAAFCDGRGYVLPEDLQELAEPVIAHRLVLTAEAQMRGQPAEQVLREIMDSVPAPTPHAAVAMAG